ncbi:LINE-1 retrotransposable element orf2 protein [Plakobranchus ocellatus]|uniref:LINE-1 retrotransposable element orf2 protein n=1 Tax=Plakobranchus ocellatus TaxID=259542 RepID=A0AAV4D5Y8_9GAST|nr:LINE-1 retrotransposable element orf2 protein [Plakobranchus ocellatus]
MAELKSNDQAKKLGAITKFLDIPVTVSPHKSLNSSKGVIRSRDLRCCSEEEMVEDLSAVTQAWRIKVLRGEDKIQTDTVILTFDSPKPPNKIRAGYLTLDSAAGPDGVNYQFLRHLPESCPHTLLKFFNNIWTTGDIPPSWREASVVPIPKLGKDPSDPSNYRPIALTSCLCKTLERMVNDRLVHVLESRNLLSNVQCGFRKDHSTLDHLVTLETFTKKAFARKKQVLAVFFDLEKAYDTTWRDWDAEGANKLHKVLPNLGEDLHRRGEGACRKLETAMCRLRVGHTWLTQSYLLKNEDQPFCYACNSLYTVRHILIECLDFQDTRRKYFSVTDLYRLFREVNPSRIVGYLKDLGVYGNI